MQSNYSVTSGNENLCLNGWIIFYIQFRKHTGIQHTTTVILVRATHSYRRTITPVSALIDVKLVFKRRLLWSVWKHCPNIIMECMRTTMEIHSQNSRYTQIQFNLHKQFRQYKSKWCGPGSSADIAADYGLEVPGSNSGRDEIFRPSRPVLRPAKPPCKMGTGL